MRLQHGLIPLALAASVTASADDAPATDVVETPAETTAEPVDVPAPSDTPADAAADDVPATEEGSVELTVAEPEPEPEPVITRPPPALSITFGGQIEYNLRFRPEKYEYGSYYQDVADPPTLSRNELKARFKVNGKIGKFGAITDIELALRFYPKPQTLSDLSDVRYVTPFFFEAHEAYMYGRDLFGLRGLDLRLGQQKVLFGVGDQFNPTNVVNPDDVEDVLLFGDQQGNLMARLDYSPRWNWQLTGILIPIFKPALLPDTGYLGQTPDRLPFTDDQTRWNLAAESYTAEAMFGYPTVVRDVKIEVPEFSPKNMQGFARVAATLGGQDIALSYYRGFNDTPVPLRNDTYQVAGEVCKDPDDPESECINGTLSSDVTLGYARYQMAGLNMSGEFDAFGWLHKSFKPLGYRFELGVFFPEEVNMVVEKHDIVLTPIAPPQDGPYEFKGNPPGNVLRAKPFAKWTLGLDYTFNKYLYMNTQWVHGFVDEFGAGDWMSKGYTTRASGIRDGVAPLECIDIASLSGKGEQCAYEYVRPVLGDYLVVGLDAILLSQSLTIRLFTIWDLIGVYHSTYDPEAGQRTFTHKGMFTKEGFSAVIYPAIQYKFGYGLELHAGALMQFGKPYSKFGAPENGGHQIWLRGRYAF